MPASSDDQGSVDAMGGMQGPVVDDLRPLAVHGAEGFAVHKQFHVREANVDRVVMPLVVTYLGVGEKLITGVMKQIQLKSIKPLSYSH